MRVGLVVGHRQFAECAAAMLVPLSAAERKTLDRLLTALVVRQDDWARPLYDQD